MQQRRCDDHRCPSRHQRARAAGWLRQPCRQSGCLVLREQCYLSANVRVLIHRRNASDQVYLRSTSECRLASGERPLIGGSPPRSTPRS